MSYLSDQKRVLLEMNFKISFSDINLFKTLKNDLFGKVSRTRKHKTNLIRP